MNKAYTIAITGKGGVGKTTVTSMIINFLSKKSNSILAIDADPNLNLNETLGVELKDTVGNIRESMRSEDTKCMSKYEFVNYKIQTSLTETDNFDLIAMGRPEGPGCYCYANNLVKESILKLINSYQFIVLDNEAGLENLSRRIVRDIDLMIIVSNPSVIGLKTAIRVKNICKDLKISIGKMGLIINHMASNDLSENLMKLIDENDLNLMGLLDDDKNIRFFSEKGSALNASILEDCKVYKKFEKILERAVFYK